MRRALLPLLLALPACGVYESAVPLGSPGDAPFDEALVGAWLVGPDESTTEDSVVVTRAGTNAYLVDYPEDEGDDGVVARKQARAFITDLPGARFLNLTAPAHDAEPADAAVADNRPDGGYLFLRYEIAGDELRFRFVSEGDEGSAEGLSGHYDSSEALRAAILGRIDDPTLYSDVVVVRRKR